MEKLGFCSHQFSPVKIVVSAVVVLTSQFGLSLVPRFLCPLFSIPAMLPVTGLVMVAVIVLGSLWKRIIGVSASAPAVVAFNVVFIWGVHYFLIRPDTSLILDILFHIECILLMVGLYRIISGDPGFVLSGFSTSGHDRIAYSRDVVDVNPLFTRIRWCSICKTNVRGFDHHCPAFGNCIGQKNHRLFLILLIGFILAETSYVARSNVTIILTRNSVLLQNTISGNLVVSTMLFSLLKIFWQMPFLIWHLYCICFNIKTDEWVHWQQYPEFHLISELHQSGDIDEAEPSVVKFRNSYDKGIYLNIKEFLRCA